MTENKFVTVQSVLTLAHQELDRLMHKDFAASDLTRSWNLRYLEDKQWAIDYIINALAEKTAYEIVHGVGSPAVIQNHANADLMAAHALGKAGSYAFSLRTWCNILEEKKKLNES